VAWHELRLRCARIGSSPEVLVSPAASVVALLAQDPGGGADNDEGGNDDPGHGVVRDADSDGQ
jgi:hypothetical protein